MCGTPGHCHLWVPEIPVADEPTSRGRGPCRVRLVNSQRDDSSRISLCQYLHASRSFWVDGVEEAGSLKNARRRFVSECILQIAVIILVWFGVNDDRMADVCLGDEFHVFFHRLRVRRV